MSDEVVRPEPRAMGNLFGREDAIRAGRCLACRTVYVRERINLWPMDAQKEYATSGCCWPCQISVFGQDRTKCTCATPCCEADVGVGVITCGGQHCLVHGEGP